MPTTLARASNPYEPGSRTFPCATEEELLDFANKVREAGGANILEALLPSIPGNPGECLIANALNFSCTVSYNIKPDGSEFPRDENGMKPWFMHFPNNMSDERRRVIAEALGTELVEVHKRTQIVALLAEGELAMRLPQHIGNAAYAFDTALAFTNYYA